MATKKTMKGREVAVPNARAVTAGGWREQMAKSINKSKQQLAKLPQMNGNFLSFRGGEISLGGVKLQNPLPTVLLDYGYERTYYSKQYQPDVMATPDCYSYDGVAPHEKASVPQSETCAKCRFNEFGSSQNGRGKGCKEGARMVLMHADHADTPEKVAAAPLMQARASVLNSKVFRSYVENVFDAEGKPTWAALTTISNVPDSKSQYALGFIPSVLPDADEDLLDAIAARVTEGEKLLDQPYPDIEEAPKPAPAAAPRRRKF